MAMDKIYFRVKGFRNRNDNSLPRKLNFNSTAVASCDASIFFKKVEDLFLITGYPVVRCHHRRPTQSVCVADCYFIVNVLDLPFPLPIAIYR